MVPQPSKSSNKKNKKKSQTETPKKNNEQSHERENESERTQDDNINVKELLARIEKLEKTVDELRSEITIVKNVNTKLAIELDDLHQYQRRSGVLVEGINHEANESDKSESQECHDPQFGFRRRRIQTGIRQMPSC